MTRGRRRLRTKAISAKGKPDVLTTQLSNGLRVVLCPRKHLAQAYAGIYFNLGSRHEDPFNNGISHVLEHMLFRGTASYTDSTQLNAAAESFGGFLEGATYRDHIGFSTGCHPSALGDAVAILGELIQSPRYKAMEVERDVLREELLETLDVRGRMVDLDNIAHHLAFGSVGLGLPIEGTLENLEAFTRKELEAHRRTHMVANNGVLCMAGPMDVDAVLSKAQRAWGTLPTGEIPKPEPPREPDWDPALRYVRNSASQVDMRISFRGVPIQDPDYPSTVMLGRLLADGLASRMHAELVDRQGLAYSLHAGTTIYDDCALFEFDITVAPDRASSAVDAILGFAGSAGRFRFTKEELQRARRRYRFGMEFMEDSPADLVGWYGRAALFDVEQELDGLGGRIQRVREGDIRASARRIFRRRGMVLTAVGELARGEWKRIRNVVNDWDGY